MPKENGNFRLSLTEALVVLPAFHVASASLFLIGYHAAFGYRIAIFAGAADLFSVTVRELASTYIFSMGMPVAYILWTRARYGGWTRAEGINQTVDPEQRSKDQERLKSDRKFFTWLISAMLLLQTVTIVVAFYRLSYIPYYLLHLFAVMVFTLALVWFANKLEMPGAVFISINLVGMMLLTSGFAGLSQGQADRRASFSSIHLNVPRCHSFALLRPLSSFYLALHRSGKHVIIDTECRPKFLLGK